MAPRALVDAVNVVALVWIAFITVLFVLPPNQLTGYTFAGALALLAHLLLRVGAHALRRARRR